MRKLKGLSQQGLAVELDITRSRLGSYEEGRSEPPIELLLRISDFFRLPADALMRHDLTRAGSESFIDIGDNRILFPVVIDEENKDRIEVVPHKASAGYLSGYSDPEYISGLPVMNLPFIPTGKHRAFQIEGDSMEPLVREGAYVVGKYLEKAESIKDGKTYVLITESKGMVYKRVYTDKMKEGLLKLKSDNSYYKPYEVELSDVREIWEYTCSLNLQDYEPEELNWQSIMEMMRDLKIELEKR